MKIKVCIVNYGTAQLKYLEKTIEGHKSYKKYQTDITVYTTVPVAEKHIMFPESIRENLPFSPRKDIADAINQYDLFLYNENDHLITEDNIDAFLEHNDMISENQITGFIRYELKDGKKILLDPNPGREPKLVNKRYEKTFSIFNDVQSCYLLTKKQLKRCIDSGGFLVPPHHDGWKPNGMYYGTIEQGSTDPFTQCNLERVFPKDIQLLERLLIRHLPTKYCMMKEWIEHGITIDQLQNY